MHSESVSTTLNNRVGDLSEVVLQSLLGPTGQRIYHSSKLVITYSADDASFSIRDLF
jgi:hypothetical protein